ncbi:MAG: DUF1800 domain-containing protein [bacterium]
MGKLSPIPDFVRTRIEQDPTEPINATIPESGSIPGSEPGRPRRRRKYVYRTSKEIKLTKSRPHPIPNRKEIRKLMAEASREGFLFSPPNVPENKASPANNVGKAKIGKPDPHRPIIPIDPPSAGASISVDGMIAANRFGMGARPGELEQASADPKGWLLAQLERPHEVLLPGMLETRECMMFQGDFEEYPETIDLYNAAIARLQSVQQKQATPGIPAFDSVWENFYRGAVSDLDVRLREHKAVISDVPLLERLVRFWSGHFAVNFNDNTMDVCGAFERDVARRHLMGKFSEMLIASTLHPAMLMFLNNVDSVGANSPAGGGEARANENLAREVFELHTMGVDGGYTQADIIEFANALTGSVVGRAWMGPQTAGRYHYLWWIHEPGTRRVLGKYYREENDTPLQAIRILNDIARHPSTARFVCTKLARHFLADEPPQSVINNMVQVWEQRDGELYYVYKALINHPSSWDPARQKLKTPSEYITSTARAIGAAPVFGAGLPYEIYIPILLMEDLGQYPYRASSPEGWPDYANRWNSPAAMMVRMQFAYQAAALEGGTIRPHVLLHNAVGRNISTNTRTVTDEAATMQQGLALTLMSPEFQAR